MSRTEKKKTKMNENDEMRHLTEEEQLEYAIQFLKEYLLQLKSQLESLENELNILKLKK